MLRLLRMYLFVSLVSKKIRLENTDDFLHGMNNKKFVTTITRSSCTDDFHIIGRHAKYTAENICESCLKNEYLAAARDYLLTTEKGDSLIEGYGWGFIRELLFREWKFVTLFFLIIGYLAGRFTR